MNILLENSYSWTGSFVDAFSNLVCDVANIIYESVERLTSNTSESNSDNPTATSSIDSSTTQTTAADAASEKVAAVSGEKSITNLSQVFQAVLDWLEFDDFQFLLLKIFICMFIGNVCLLYIAWYIYGARITWLLSPHIKPENLKKESEKFQFPKSYSPRL